MQLLFFLVVTIGACGNVAGTTLKANYNVGGITGTVTFTQQAVGQQVDISLNLVGVPTGTYTLELHEYRVNFDTRDVCSNDNIGDIIGTASVSSGTGSLSVNGMDLSGTKSIEGRSFLLRNTDSSIRTCATIEADADYITAFAHLPAGLGGSIIFRQQDNSPSADTFMYVDLYFVGQTKVSTPLDWQINSGTVQMDINANTDLANRCGSTIKDMYNPDGSSGDGCSTSNHANCKIGDLTAKHGPITINMSGRTRAFFGDLKLPLSGVNSIIDKTVAFRNGDTYFACANIKQYHRMSANAMYNSQNVAGTIDFFQRSPLDPVLIHVNLNNLDAQGGGYHVHEWPVPQKIGMSDSVCDGTSVGGHFNPFSIDTTPGTYPSAASTTPERYEVGDLSGKFGLLNGMYRYNESYVDPNIQLYGMNSIIGKSLVIHKRLNAQRWVCSSIWPGDDIQMTVAYARFTYPVIGYIVLQQPKDMWWAETQIYIELNYGMGSMTRTINHTWHVHERAMGDDMMSAEGRCQSVGGHYNPYVVDLGGDYSTMCAAQHNQFRCEVGDLSGKHGKISIRKDTGDAQKYFFSDMQLPLSGPQSVVGKSITIHGANSGGSRLSCANLILKSPRVVRVSKWSAAENGGSPAGSITFTQDAVDLMTGMTKVEVRLSGLHSEVAAYHVHEFPTDISSPPAAVCQASDTGGHLNPFGANYPGPSNGTEDAYEIGDLSGKYEMLSGTSYSMSNIDMSLPLEGPHSIVGRSIVLHKSTTGAPRWACGNIIDITPGSVLMEARAVFDGEVKGYVHMSQYRYANGDMSDTNFIVNLKYKGNNSITTGHNWHIHEKHVTGEDCMSCGPHYNPFDVDMGPEYTTECSISNPLRCEVGDQAGKMGRYDIGSGKKFFTDINANLEGKFAAAKRSIVIHGQNGAGPRIACANIVPYGDTMRAYELSFLRVQFTREDVERKVALSLATSADNVLVVPKSETVDCDTVTVYFLGPSKDTLQNQFNDVIRSNNHDLLGPYAPNGPCAIGGTANDSKYAEQQNKESRSMPCVSLLALLVCICISKLTIWS